MSFCSLETLPCASKMIVTVDEN
uniref:Uncharacterized protein n=1 Tax=Anguilla anguilla TaxID=7936 RepID=A0A0E9U6M9_ANGAN